MSRPFELSEPIIKGLKLLFQEHAAEVATLINSEVTDGFQIKPPAQILDYLPTPAQLGGGLPVIAIGDGPVEIVNDLVSSVESEPILAVEAIVQHSDPRALTWQLRRYLQLISAVIQKDRTLKGTTPMTIFRGVEPGGIAGPREPESDEGYLQWSYVLIGVRRSEV